MNINQDATFDNFIYAISNNNLTSAINMYPLLRLSEDEKSQALSEINRVGSICGWNQWQGTKCRQLMSAIQKKNSNNPKIPAMVNIENITQPKFTNWIGLSIFLIVSAFSLYFIIQYWFYALVSIFVLILVIMFVDVIKNQ